MKIFVTVMTIIFTLGGGIGCSLDECKTRLKAQSFDSTNMCMTPPQDVGCTNADGCDGSVTWAIDANGRCFFFPSLCVPVGFTVVQTGDVRCPAIAKVAACGK